MLACLGTQPAGGWYCGTSLLGHTASGRVVLWYWPAGAHSQREGGAVVWPAWARSQQGSGGESSPAAHAQLPRSHAAQVVGIGHVLLHHLRSTQASTCCPAHAHMPHAGADHGLSLLPSSRAHAYIMGIVPSLISQLSSSVHTLYSTEYPSGPVRCRLLAPTADRVHLPMPCRGV
jgi:hypothetical protein